MANSLARSTGNPTATSTTMEMDDDDKTVQSRGNGSKNDEELKDFLIKITIRPKRRELRMTKSEVLNIHRNICQAMLAIPGTLTIVDNSKEEHAFASSIKGTEQQFKPKQRNNDNQWIIIVRIITDLSLSTIKNYYEVNEQLSHDKYKVFIHQHFFKEDEWNIAKIGFLHNVHVGHVPKDLAKTRLLEKLKQQDKLYILELFSTFVTCDTQKGPIRTQAYEIQCNAKDAKQLGRLLEKALVLTPYYYKRKDPATFEKSVKIQNHCLSNLWVMKVEGVSTDLMKELEPALKNKYSKISDITPTRRTEADGEWRIIIAKDHFISTTNELRAAWESDLTILRPEAIHVNKTKGLDPRITSRPNIPDDSDSEADSVGTALTGYLSTFSLPEDDISLDAPPARYGGNRNYAAAVKATNWTPPRNPYGGRGQRQGRGGRDGYGSVPKEVPNPSPAIDEIMIMLKELQEENRVLKETLLAQTKHVPPPAPAPESPSTITPLTAADQHDRFTSLEKLVRDLSQTVLSLAQGGLTIAPVEPASIQTSEQPLGKRPCHSTTPVSRRLQYTEMDTFEDDLEVQPSEISISHRKAGGQSSPLIKKC
jgi:hypothetical protein